MAFANIDAPGNRRDRRAVAAIQRRHGAAARVSAAEERRRKRAARRGVVVFKMPAGGVSMATPDGAYAWGGNAEVEGRYQIVVVGAPKGPPDRYREALAAWLGKPLRMVSAEPLPLPARRAGILAVDERAFLSIILEPEGAS